MKKQFLIAVMAVVLFASCEKKTELFEKTDESIAELGYYKLGTILKSSTNSKAVNDKIMYTESKGKIMFADSKEKVMHVNISPYTPGTFPQVAMGTYFKNTEVARSSNGLYSLIFQGDGNLVLFKLAYQNGPVVQPGLWHTNVYNSGPGPSLPNTGVKVVFGGNGSIELYDYSWNQYWNASCTSSPKPIWILQDDGNLVGYKDYSIDGAGNITILATNFASTMTAGGTSSRYVGRVKIKN